MQMLDVRGILQLGIPSSVHGVISSWDSVHIAIDSNNDNGGNEFVVFIGNDTLSGSTAKELFRVDAGYGILKEKRELEYKDYSSGQLNASKTRQYVFSGFRNGARMIVEVTVHGSFGSNAAKVTSKKFISQFSPWSDGMYSLDSITAYALGYRPADLVLNIGAVGSGAQYYMNITNNNGVDFINYAAHFRIYSASAMDESKLGVTVTDY